MRRDCQITAEARSDLLSIWEFIAQDNVRAANRVMERIERACRMLARFPRNGHRRRDVQTSCLVLFWPVSPYVIVYRPSPKPVLVIRVLHSARDLNALL